MRIQNLSGILHKKCAFKSHRAAPGLTLYSVEGGLTVVGDLVKGKGHLMVLIDSCYWCT